MDCQNCHEPDENFSIVLSGIQPAGVSLGRKQQCTVTILNDDAGLPERLRMDWSRLRFPDSSKLTRGLNDGGREVADRLGVLLEEQVQEFYMRQHKQKLEKVKVVRDLCHVKLLDIQEDINSTIHRRGVVEAAMQIQHRLDGEVVDSSKHALLFSEPYHSGKLWRSQDASKHHLYDTLDWPPVQPSSFGEGVSLIFYCRVCDLGR